MEDDIQIIMVWDMVDEEVMAMEMVIMEDLRWDMVVGMAAGMIPMVARVTIKAFC
jgi:hypothetical protein